MWFLKSFLLALLGLPITLLGLPLVALGLLFKRVYPETTKPFTQYPGNWTLVRLPQWLLPWDNLFDGFMGDKRGWWSNQRGGKADSFWAMWLWGATRNPANYWSRIMTGVDLSRCVITKISGVDEVLEEPGVKNWQFLVAIRDDGKKFHRFFLSWAFPWNDKLGLMIDIGWKVKLSHNGTLPTAPIKDRIRGSVFTINPIKKLT